jgi:hypothetical protein
VNPIKLHMPREEVFTFSDDLTAWTSNSGIDPRVTQFHEPGMTTNMSSPVQYLIYVDESFFEQFPKWRQYIEQ